MLDPRRHAAALVAALALWSPASALAQAPMLLAQIDDATPTPTPGSQPPLSEDIPGGDDGDGQEQEDETTGPSDSEEREQLADTGLEAGLVALLGLGLIASGSGLRVTLRRAD